MKIMKKLLTFILIFLVLESSSQKYNGVDLDGDLYSVINNLNKSGYTMLGSVINGAILKSTSGDNSQIFLCATRSSNTIFRTAVYSEKMINPSDLKNEYNYYYNLVKKEYGKPTSIYKNSAFWINEIIDISIEVTNLNQIKVVYDNKINLNTKKYEEYNNQ
jgi:hypothetical protein